MKNLIALLMAHLLLLCVTCYASDNKKVVMDDVRRTIKDICQAPSDRGKYWDVNFDAYGNAFIKFKLFSQLSGKAQLKKGEWEGVQKVLQEQQAADNADYRACVKQLTPLFLNNYNVNAELKAKQKNKTGNRLKEEKKGQVRDDYVKNVYVADFDSKGKLVFHNTGKEDIFVSDVTLYCDSPHFSTCFPVNKLISAKSYLVHDIGPDSKWEMSPLTQEQWQKAMQIFPRESGCYQWRFYYTQSSVYLTGREYFGPYLQALALEGRVNFYITSSGQTFTFYFPVDGVPLFNVGSKDCVEEMKLQSRAKMIWYLPEWLTKLFW